jgi:hypothetical protein
MHHADSYGGVGADGEALGVEERSGSQLVQVQV